MAPLLDEYIEYCETYSRQYGDKTAVLLQCGDFFELYSVPAPFEGAAPRGANIHVIADICNLQVTRKNKSIIEASIANPNMAGFPMHALTKHTQGLLANGYTVVIVRQITPPPNVTRKVTEILSPSTSMQPLTPENTFLMCFFIESGSVGVAGVDLSTGITFITEMSRFIHEEIHRLIYTYPCVEAILYNLDDSIPDFPSQCLKNLHVRKYASAYKSISYQSKVLRGAYSFREKDFPIEELELERYDVGRHAFVLLLEFAYEHSSDIIKNLRRPKLLNMHGCMGIEYNSALQLDLISEKSGQGLMHLLNRCSTAFGKRMFRDRLMTPLTLPSELEQRYDAIDTFIQDPSGILKKVRCSLGKMYDIERIMRRMQVGRFVPLDWPGFLMSLEVAGEIFKTLNHKEGARILDPILDEARSTLDSNECAKYTLTDMKGSVFQRGHYPSIDDTDEEIKTVTKMLLDIASNLNCKFDHSDKHGYYLYTTKKRWDAMKKGPEYQVVPLSVSSMTVRITSHEITHYSLALTVLIDLLNEKCIDTFKEYIQQFASKHADGILELTRVLSEIDVSATNARNAIDFGYCRPELAGADAVDNSSFADFTGIRHPIIERVQEKVDYVPNDVKLSNNGILLYGINAAGKSSLMKAIGLGIIMAQAGMYVAATRMKFQPYERIFTRITKMDDLYNGMSTFMVEMSELKNILRRACAHSLVLGDELCAGTESVSALAIVAAGVERLLKMKAAFVFATHLHDLIDIPRVRDLERLEVYHMHIETDSKTGKLIFDRKLRPGRGTSLYGLEVAISLGMPMDFVRSAQDVRRYLLDEDRSLSGLGRVSRYNALVDMDRCGICGSRASETHHIRYQKDADSKGWVDNGVHKNRASNLVPLCEKCHGDEHAGRIRIQGYRTTLDGSISLVWRQSC